MYTIIKKSNLFCMLNGLVIVTSAYILYITLAGGLVFFNFGHRYSKISSLKATADKGRAVPIKNLSNFSTHQDGRVNSLSFSLVDVEQKGRKVTFMDDLIRNKSGKHSNTLIVTSNNSTDRSGPQIGASYPVVQVGFFEGGRLSWIYKQIFQPPISPRTCECTSNEIRFQAVVTLERNASKTGKYELLFIPHDVGISQMKNNVWDTILSSAPSQQRRVYATFEGAWKLRYLATSLAEPYRRKAFHWSLTHHSKSDFAQPYGYFQPSTKVKPSKNWAEGKNGLMAWMSSWSKTSWKRKTFVENLQKHISVHLYGLKYRKCPRNSKLCEEKIRGYKFYMALENSCCGEYITEKFWRTLSWDIVPVVLGAAREDYERLAPPHSFIYIDDFSSMADLANYLRLLDKNDDLYNQYFRWKETGKVHLNYPPIHQEIVNSKKPPDGFFYSCPAVCKVAKKYLSTRESYDNLRVDNRQTSTNVTYFDPNVNWWCGSCGKCGKHRWVREFNN